MASDAEFVDLMNQQADELTTPPRGSDVSRGSLPGGVSGVGVPGYPVEVVSTYPVIPLNATEFDVEFSDVLDSQFPGAGGSIGIGQISYSPPPGYVAVIKKISWNIWPRRFFLTNMGTASLTINGIVNDAVRNLSIADAGEFNLHVIAPINSTAIFSVAFVGTYGGIAGTQYVPNQSYSSKAHMRIYGHLLFSRGLPANFEIGS